MKIIAFSGRKQSGKTTAVNDLWGKVDSPRILNFADALKWLILTNFMIPTEKMEFIGKGNIEAFDNEEYKNKVHPCGKTCRELLQLIGTDWFRAVWPDIWVANYKQGVYLTEMSNWTKTIITADVRFPNEVKCVQDLGGHVIRLLRSPHDDQHESETALDNYSLNKDGVYVTHRVYNEGKQRMRGKPGFDAIIDNREMSIEEQNEAVWKLVTDKGWV